MLASIGLLYSGLHWAALEEHGEGTVGAECGSLNNYKHSLICPKDTSTLTAILSADFDL